MIYHKSRLYRDTLSKDQTPRFIVKEVKGGLDIIHHSRRLFGNWYVKNSKTKPFRDYHGNFQQGEKNE